MRKPFILAFMLLIGIMAQAQNSTPVVSEVQVYDLGGGTGLIEVRLSGNNLELVNAVPVSISGDAILGGTANLQTSSEEYGKITSNVNTKILTGTFSINQSSTDKMVLVTVPWYRGARYAHHRMR